MRADGIRILRGAVAGAAAAAVWAGQQPLDKRLLGSGYDDVELLGKGVTSGPAWYPIGLALHLANGALFGATYAAIVPSLPIPRPAAGPIAGLTEHLALWPLGRVTDRVHPAREELTPLTGNPRAFAQATWRHLLFGVVLGELERRLNREPEEPVSFEEIVSSNGHGTIEHAAAAARPAH